MSTTAPLLVALTAALSACGGGGGGGGDTPAGAAILLAVGGDYAGSGIASTVTMPDLEVTQNAVAGVVGGDPAIRRLGDRLFILDKFGGDTVTILNRDDLTLVGQLSVGAGMNPQDVAVVDRRLYVAALDAAGLLVFDLDDLSASPQLIDLSGLDSQDGIPDCGSVVAIDERLYVACGRFDRSSFPWQTIGVGVVAVVDAGAHTVVDELELTHENPFGWLESAAGAFDDELLIATVPDPFVELDRGCVERIAVGDDPGALGCLVDHARLGGYASGLVWSGDALWVAVTTSFDDGELARYDPDADHWQVGGIIPPASNPTDLARCPTGHVVVADNSPASRGLRVLGADGAEITGSSLDVGWPEAFLPSHTLVCY